MRTQDTCNSEERAVRALAGGERGSAAVELTFMTSVLVVFLLIVVAFGRITSAEGELGAAVRDAARAASLERTPEAARAAAEAAATASLGGEGLACRSHEIAVDTSRFGAGGDVAVELTCTVGLGDVALLRLPGEKTLRARFVAPLDPYRGPA